MDYYNGNTGMAIDSTDDSDDDKPVGLIIMPVTMLTTTAMVFDDDSIRDADGSLKTGTYISKDNAKK